MPLQAGKNPVRLHAALNTPGALDLSIAVRSATAGEVRFEQAVMMRRPKVLYVSEDPPELDAHLPQTLQAAQFDVDRQKDFSTARLNDYQLVIANNWDLEAASTQLKEQLEQYEKQGGGLLVIAGEHSNYLEGKTKEDALDRALPATLAPPRLTLPGPGDDAPSTLAWRPVHRRAALTG